MPFYLFQAKYTADALKALVETPQDREAGARTVIEAAGGKLHSFFFCLGEYDAMAVIEAPDDESMAAGALAVGASGAFSAGQTTKLMTAAEGMAAMKAAQAARAAYTPATG